MSCARAVVLAALCLLPLASCRDATQITVDVTTDVKCPDVKGTSLTIGTLDGLDGRPATAQTTACTPGAVARIGKIVVVPSGEKDDAVAVRVVLGFGRDPAECVAPTFGPGCIVARRSLRYVPHENLTLPIFMSAACNGVACGPTETCVRGACKPATIADPSLCTKAEGCGEEALGSVTTDAGASPDVAAPPPCSAGAVCDVVSASDIVDVAVAAGALFWLDVRGNVTRAATDGTGARVIVRSEQVPVAGLEADKQSYDASQEVIVALIGGVGEDGFPSYSAVGDQAFLADYGIDPGCVGANGEQAVPPVRMREFVEAFGDDSLFSVCAADYTGPLELIAKRMRDQIQPARQHVLAKVAGSE